MLIPLLLLAALFALLVLLGRHRRLRTDVPGPSPLPLLGNAWRFRNTELCFRSLCKLKEKYGNIFRVYLGNILYVAVCDPLDIQKVLSNSHITDRDPYIAYVMSQIIGDGLLTSRGQKWKKNRKMLAPTFHNEVLNKFLHTFNKQASVLADSLVDHCGEDIDIHSLVSVSTLEMICESALGSSIDVDGQEVKVKIGDLIARLIHLLEERITRPWLAADWLYALTSRGREQKRLLNVWHGFADAVITRKMESGQYSKSNKEGPLRTGFMDTILREGGETLLPKSEIRDESMTLIGAGFETTAKSLCFTLCLLAHHKDWQAAVHQELDDIFLHGEDNERPLTSEDVADLLILDCVIKESLRLFPVAPFLPRELPCDITLGSNKLVVPKGASVFVIPYFTHRMSELYPNPEVFDPTRFYPENSEGRNSYNYIPFGIGPRICIGKRYAMMQMKVILAWILRRYHIVAATSREELEKLHFSITIKPVNGFKLQLQRRHL